MTKEVKLGRVEKNISRLNSKTYRVRVGKNDKCVRTRKEARHLKNIWLENK